MPTTIDRPLRHVTTPRSGPSVGARRVGYGVAALINLVLVWVTHQLLDWEWPGFLTPDFDRVLPIVTASLLVSVAANAWFSWSDSGWRKPAGDLATSAIGFVAAVRVWQVFPFDFTGYEHDWSWLVRGVLILAVAGTAIGTAAAVVKLSSGSARDAFVDPSDENRSM